MSEMLHRCCPVCDCRKALPFLIKNELCLVTCASCLMIYASPVKSAMATGKFYDESGLEYLAPDKLGSDYAQVRFERELRLFRARCGSGSVLDVGCSSGGFLYNLRRKYSGDYQVLGTDVSTAPLAHAAAMGVPVARGDFLTQCFEQQFDAITFWAVMEHLANPGAFLKKASSLLKPGGLCFILVPNLNSLAVRILGRKYRYIFSEHLNYFTARTLAKFLKREFVVSELLSTHFNPLVIWKDLRGGGREIPRSERAKLLRQTNAYKKSPWWFPARLAYKTGEKALGRFFLADNLIIIGLKI